MYILDWILFSKMDCSRVNARWLNDPVRITQSEPAQLLLKYVDPNTDVTGDGSSSNPFKTAGEALSALATSGDSRVAGASATIMMAPGTYTETLTYVATYHELDYLVFMAMGKVDLFNFAFTTAANTVVSFVGGGEPITNTTRNLGSLFNVTGTLDLTVHASSQYPLSLMSVMINASAVSTISAGYLAMENVWVSGGDFDVSAVPQVTARNSRINSDVTTDSSGVIDFRYCDLGGSTTTFDAVTVIIYFCQLQNTPLTTANVTTIFVDYASTRGVAIAGTPTTINYVDFEGPITTAAANGGAVAFGQSYVESVTGQIFTRTTP